MAEQEVNNVLPFLDTLVIRNANNKLEIDIYRRGTNTNRFIPRDSNHCDEHKISAINFLVNRLVRFPLNKRRFHKELEFIQKVATFNDFSSMDA